MYARRINVRPFADLSMYMLEFCKPLSVFGKTFRRINAVRGVYI